MAALAGVLVLAVVAALDPALQTWAARRALASRPGLGLSVRRVAVGLGTASVEDLRIERAGMVLTAPNVDAHLGVLAACLGRGYSFETLVARGWTLDLTEAAGAAGSGADAPSSVVRTAGAVLAVFNLPKNLALSGVDLEGDVRFPGEDGRPAGKVHIVITGGGLAAGSEGRFLCRAVATLDDPAAPVSRVSMDATLTLSIEPGGGLVRSDLKANAIASGRGVPSGIGLSFAASTSHSAAAKSYAFSLMRGSEHIASVDAQNPEGSLTFAGSWQLNLRDTDLAPFALGRSLPAFYAAGGGSVQADASSGDLHALGKLQVTADRLGVLARGLAPLGRVTLAADFDVARTGPSLRVARLDMSLSGAAPVASVRALQSFEFNAETGELKVAVPSGDLVGISVTSVPLSWLKAALPAVSLSGGDLRGDFIMRAEDGRMVLRTRAPLMAEEVSIARPAGVIATGLELSAFVMADYAPQGWQVQLAPFAVRGSDGIRLLSLETRFGRLAGPARAIKAAGTWSASLPALLAVPAASGLLRLSSGEASGSFEASLDTTSEVHMKLAVRGLSPLSPSALPLPALDSEIRADFEPGGRATFSIPLRLDYGTRIAEIALKGSVETDPKGAFIDASLEGSEVSGDDIAGLLLLCRGGIPVAGRAPGAPRVSGPFWPPLRGKFALRFEAISLDKVDLRDVRGTLRVDPASLGIEAGTANLAGGGSAKLDGQVVFLPGAEIPLSFKADLSVSALESAPLFKAIDPSKPPVVDGKFDIESHLSGSGTGPGDLLDAVQGDFQLLSKDGTFRVLHADIIDSIKQAPSKLVDALDTVSSLFGKKTDKIGQALLNSANGLSEIHYDQMTITALRGSDLDVRLTGINLIAPEARIVGTGRITYASGVSLQDQPLSVDLNLATRGQLGKFLDVVDLLSDERDSLGYTKLTQPIHLGGTLRAVDQSQWKDMLVQASLKKGGGLFDKLLGR